MPEQDDKNQEQGQEKDEESSSGEASGIDWQARAKHSQSIADQRDARVKSLEKDLADIKATQDAAQTEELKKREEYKKLYEDTQGKLSEVEKAKEALSLQVELSQYLAEKHPDFVPDQKWIAPHVTSKESIAPVIEEYVKAHPKAQGLGAASMGNSTGGSGKREIPAADLKDPTKSMKLLEDEPDLMRKIEAGEIIIT